jgi:hypothetical protein
MMGNNMIRLSGDLLHLIAICMVLYRIFVKKNAQGTHICRNKEQSTLVLLARFDSHVPMNILQEFRSRRKRRFWSSLYCGT